MKKNYFKGFSQVREALRDGVCVFIDSKQSSYQVQLTEDGLQVNVNRDYYTEVFKSESATPLGSVCIFNVYESRTGVQLNSRPIRINANRFYYETV